MSSTQISELNCVPNFEAVMKAAEQKMISLGGYRKVYPICLCHTEEIREETRRDKRGRLKDKGHCRKMKG